MIHAGWVILVFLFSVHSAKDLKTFNLLRRHRSVARKVILRAQKRAQTIEKSGLVCTATPLKAERDVNSRFEKARDICDINRK